MAFKLKIRSKFPAYVNVNAPITLAKAGVSYTFGFDVDNLRESLDLIYAPSSILNAITITAAGTYAVQAADNIVLINKTVAVANSVQLPLAAARNGLPVTVKDLKGDASTNNITILPSGAETIDALASVVINSNYGGYKLWPLASGGWLILP